MKLYRILKHGEFIRSQTPGEYAGWGPGKIFGRLDCKSGMRMKKENRVFFHRLEDAITEGYRPCQKCRPIDEKDFEEIKHLVPQCESLDDFYKMH
ncbi:Metal binding domain of Ada [uncultured archaeon]|nr:Metal binding domain of Ada [uncultured archaeon]